jgi:hypothetical protein
MFGTLLYFAHKLEADLVHARHVVALKQDKIGKTTGSKYAGAERSPAAMPW